MNDRAASGDTESLPWLEPVDDEDQPRGVSAGKMLAALLMVGIAVAIVAGTYSLWGAKKRIGSARTVRAEAGPYRCAASPAGWT